jgi:hypothetical protein
MDDDRDDKDNKTIFEKLTDAFNSAIDTASAAATKAMEPDPGHVAEKTNEQASIGDAAIAPEAVPAIGQDNNKPPMTADEIAHHAAADTQPVVTAKKAPRKKAATKAPPKKAAKPTAKKKAAPKSRPRKP